MPNGTKQSHDASAKPEFSTAELISPPRRASWKVMVPVWAALIGLVAMGYYLGWDARVVAGGALVLAILSNAIAWLAAIVGLVPIAGPLIVKVLALPVIWLLNAIGYGISLIAIRRGYSRDVLTYRGLTIALIVGIVIGYVVGKFL